MGIDAVSSGIIISQGKQADGGQGLELDVGQSVRGEVVNISENGAVIRLNNGALLNAKLSPDVQIAKGQEIVLQVSEKFDGGMVMRIVPDDARGGVAQLLTRLGLDVNKSNADIMKAMLQNGVTPSKELINQAAMIMKQLPGASVREAVFMAENKLPATPGQLDALRSISQPERAAGQVLSDVLGVLKDTGETIEISPREFPQAVVKGAETGADNAGAVLDQAGGGAVNNEQAVKGQSVVAENMPGQNVSGQDTAGQSAVEQGSAGQAAGAQNIAEGQDTAGRTVVEQNITDRNITEQPAADINSLDDSVQGTKHEGIHDTAQSAAGRDGAASGVWAADGEAMVSREAETIGSRPADAGIAGDAVAVGEGKEAAPEEAGENIQSGRRVANEAQKAAVDPEGSAIRQAAEKILSEHGKETSAEKVLNNLFAKMGDEMEQPEAALKAASREWAESLDHIKSAVLNSKIASGNIASQLDNLKAQSDTADQFTKFAYVQIPVQVFDRQRTAELYVLKRDPRRGSIDAENATILLALDTENIGRVETLIKVEGKNVYLKFKMEEYAQPVVKRHTVDMFKALQAKGFRLADMRVENLVEPVSPLNAETVLLDGFITRGGKVDISL